MPAIYAHDRFGAMTAAALPEDLRSVIRAHYPQFRIGLQGPDIFFFYRAYGKNQVNRYGNRLHHIPARSFFLRARRIVGKYGRNSARYAYLLGFVCHFALDSECHPYVNAQSRSIGVTHLEIEAEFEKYLLRRDLEEKPLPAFARLPKRWRDPLAFPLSALIPADDRTVAAIAPYYPPILPVVVKRSLKWMRLVKRFFRAPGPVKQGLLNGAMGLAGHADFARGIMLQRRDDPRCAETNAWLWRRLHTAVPVAVSLMQDFDESLAGADLGPRFNRTFD